MQKIKLTLDRVHGLALKSAASLLCVFAFVFAAAAQGSVVVSGKVTDEAGAPVIGAAVVIGDTNKGTSADLDGNYSLSVTPGAELHFSSIGYVSRVIKVGGQTKIDVVLQEDFAALEATVVVGYGTQKAASLTGAVASVKMDEVLDRPTPNVVAALQGTTPGLIIEQSNSAPGARPSINIRGLNTMNDNNPLILIDGIVGDIQNVSSNDIESISVLKDAASASIYGSRASNGVILITTKKGKSGSSSINYDFNYGIQQATCLPDIVDSWVYAELRNEALVNSGQAAAFTPEQIAGYRNGGTNCNWMKEIYRNAPMQTHTLSATGGNDRTTYLVSGSYMNQQSMFNAKGLGMDRYMARMNVSHKVFDNFQLTATASYTHNNITDHAYWTEWIIEQATRMPSIYPIKNEDGTYTYPSGSNSNSLERLQAGGYRRSLNDDLNGTISADWEIIKGLHLKAMAGGKLAINSTHENRKASLNPLSGDKENHISENQHRTFDLTTNATLSYAREIAGHNFSVLAGYSYEGEKYRWFGTQRIYDGEWKYDIIGGNQSGDLISNDGNGNAWALHSVFARLNYNYKDKYLVEVNVRDDMSSKFQKKNRAAVFPSVSAGWRISEESFWGNAADYVPSMKIRGSWGLVGNDRIGLYQYMANVGQGTGYTFNNSYATTAWFGSSNPDLRWESTRMVDVGVDISLLRKGNLNISFDWFDNMTRDILVTLPVAGVFGGGEPIQNAGKVRTWGWETNIGYVLQTGSVRQNFNLNVSDSQNKVVDTKGTETIGGYDIYTIIKEGYPLWSYYAYRCTGIFQTKEEIANAAHLEGITPKPGDLRYLDKNGDGVISEDNDRYVVGNRYPRYTFGFNYSLEWNGLDFSMFWQGVGKRSVWLRGESVEAFHNNNEGPVFGYHLNRWTPVNNVNATYPRLTVGSESANNAAKSNFWIENAAYIRLKNIQLGYTLPENITRKACISRLRIYASCENAFTFSNMKGGWDPEVSDGSGRIYPVTRTISFGLNVSFNPRKK